MKHLFDSRTRPRTCGIVRMSDEFETAACGHDAHRRHQSSKAVRPTRSNRPTSTQYTGLHGWEPTMPLLVVVAAWASAAAAAAAAAAARRRSMSSGGGADDDVGIIRTDEGPDGARRGWRQRSEP